MSLAFDDRSVDASYHVNCSYSGLILERGVSECFGVLRAGGLIVTGSKLGLTDAVLGTDREYDPEGTFNNTDEHAHAQVLESAGFTDISSEQREGCRTSH